MDVGVTGRQFLVRARAGLGGVCQKGYDHSSARGVAISCRPIAALRRTISNLVDNAIK
jgi:hypothetical protein